MDESSSPLELDAPTGIRTPVLALKGLRPGPLDDGGKRRDFTIVYLKRLGIPYFFFVDMV